MSKFYPEIILGVDDFSPQKIIKRNTRERNIDI